MAKLEKKIVKSKKMLKGKKRKHSFSDNDDEVASKSLIVESPPVVKEQEQEQDIEKDKGADAVESLKRKSKTKSKIKEKRSKRSQDDETSDNENNENEQGEPSLEELIEIEKPENQPALVTVRQKKKQKHQLRMEAQNDQSVDKERKRNEKYLEKWKFDRPNWKFEKLRQISIQQSVFDGEKISNDLWSIALEYLSGSKGAAKETIIKLAEECIDRLDKDCMEKTSSEERQSIVESEKYRRARDLLQSFD